MSTAQELGISKERMQKINELIIAQAEEMQKRKDDLNTATLVKNMAGVPNGMEEALLIGIALGESLLAMKLGPLGALAMVAGKI